MSYWSTVPSDVIDASLVILEHGAPLSALAPMLSIWEDADEVCDLGSRFGNRSWWADLVEALTGNRPAQCEDCNYWVAADDCSTVACDRIVCQSCLEYNYFYCGSCDEYESTYGATYIESIGRTVCESCLEGMFYCEDCDEYYPDECDRHGGCQCDAPVRSFTFRGIANDTETTLEVPAGEIDHAGLRAIGDRLRADHDILFRDLDKLLTTVGAEWQGKRGNFPRRLSREAHKLLGLKLSADTLSAVGNLAKLHASDASTRTVAFTRDLNLPASEFVHEDSCWWQSYYASRCALKSWGGIGMRTFTNGYATGRAWILPLDAASLSPTHNADGASAYVVFNAYGDLTGYQAARLVAGMAGMTYKRIEFVGSPMYVNGDVGFLVSDEETCSRVSAVHLDMSDEHAQADAALVLAARMAVPA